MNTKTLALFLSVTSLSGCVISGNGPYSGNVQFTWSFAGLTCSSVPQVASVAITIPGEILENNGVYPCLTNNYPGIVLHDFLPATYSFTIQALDANGTVLYSASGGFSVNGDVAVTVDLTPTAAAPSYAYLTWSFPPNSISANPTCSQAGVDVVDVTIDQGQPQRYACSDGQTQPGALTVPLNAGQHTITLVASSQAIGYPYYWLLRGVLQTTASTPVSAAYLLQWAVGGVSVQWQISGNDCFNIPVIYVNFRDSNGNFLYPGAGDRQNCTDGLAPGGAIRYDYLPQGNYSLTLQGLASGGFLYTNYPYTPVTITAGYFSDSQTVRSMLHYP
jgi:hypothetical protein